MADLSKRTGAATSDVTVKSIEAVDWPDSSLGCPRPGFAYSQIVTPGYRIVLSAMGKDYEYHSGRTPNFVYCGP